MRKLSTPITVLFSLCSVVIALAPAARVAAEVPESVPDQPVIITEIQTGAAKADDEFIELYNRSDEPVDITGWEIRQAPPGEEPVLLARAGTLGGASIILPAHAYFVFRSPTGPPGGEYQQTYSPAHLTKTDRAVVLYGLDRTSCVLDVRDAVAWQRETGPHWGEGGAMFILSDMAFKDKLLQRFVDAEGNYVDTDYNQNNFYRKEVVPSQSAGGAAAGATPGAPNTKPEPVLGNPGQSSQLAPLQADGCVTPPAPPDPPEEEPDPEPPAPPPLEPAPDEPPEDTPPLGETEPELPPEEPLLPPSISEVMPNPASPQTDAADEFIELYNPNNQPLDLEGLILEAGLTTKYRYTFPAGSFVPPLGYTAVFSAVTGLTLSNTEGQVRLLDDSGAVLSQTDIYSNAQEGQAWVLMEGKWQWTAMLTPAAANRLGDSPTPTAATKPTAKPKTSTKSATSTKKAETKPKEAKTAKPKTQTVAASGANNQQQKFNPVHPGVLAAIAVIALLYGAYEYRGDLANKLQKLREHRTARRQTRRITKRG